MSYADTVVGGLPKDNLTILSLAQSFAKSIHHEVPPDHGAEWEQSERTLLRNVARYAPVTVTHAWPIQATHEKDVASMGYRFDFSNGLSATGVLFRSVNAPDNAPTVIIMADAGMPSTTVDVANQVNRGRRVLVLDPLFFGENSPGGGSGMMDQYTQLLNSVGVRIFRAGGSADQWRGRLAWQAPGSWHSHPWVAGRKRQSFHNAGSNHHYRRAFGNGGHGCGCVAAGAVLEL